MHTIDTLTVKASLKFCLIYFGNNNSLKFAQKMSVLYLNYNAHFIDQRKINFLK